MPVLLRLSNVGVGLRRVRQPILAADPDLELPIRDPVELPRRVRCGYIDRNGNLFRSFSPASDVCWRELHRSAFDALKSATSM